VLPGLAHSFRQQKRTQRSLVTLGGTRSYCAPHTNGRCSRRQKKGGRTVVVGPCKRVQHLPFHKRRLAMAGKMRFPTPLAVRRVPKNCASRAEKRLPGGHKAAGVTTRSASIHGSAELPCLGRCRRLPAWRRHILSATHRTHAPSITVAPPPSLCSGSQADLYASSTRCSPVRFGCHRRQSPGSPACATRIDLAHRQTGSDAAPARWALQSGGSPTRFVGGVRPRLCHTLCPVMSAANARMLHSCIERLWSHRRHHAAWRARRGGAATCLHATGVSVPANIQYFYKFGPPFAPINGCHPGLKRNVFRQPYRSFANNSSRHVDAIAWPSGGGALGDASIPGTPAGCIAASAHGGTYSHVDMAWGTWGGERGAAAATAAAAARRRRAMPTAGAVTPRRSAPAHGGRGGR